MPKITYKQAGVDIKGADEFVKGIKQFVSKGRSNAPSAFGSLFDLKPLLKKYKNPLLVSSTDGVGTKLRIAKELGVHESIGIDLVAMNVNDIICLGATPLFFLDYIACGELEPQVLKEVVGGIHKGLREAGCSLLGGETAEMPGMYRKGEYDLAGFCVGIVDKNKIIDGRKIKQGDCIIGLESSGLHSNGFSLVRKVLNTKEINKYGKELLTPTRIYVKLVLSLLSTINYQLSTIKGIAHITGGAFYNKATKILPKGYGMVIDKKSWCVPKIFKIIQQKAKLDDREMYTVFNMGIGMILVVDKKQAKKIINILDRKVGTYIIGEIVKSNRRMALV
ncbi:MAG: phosphoribosylformylglycinamidine cyclo-ligase [Candidatus Omnitrophica bacterium]|nr:phosphoribosylformylglycinamidine cyclo-ligase [Candidatus Omnitrophota bacterium]MBU2436825.1 phosphoribosylformylglycinamidine cyclo-ligase [Candidatus Omnitrophota bacterium]